METMDNHEIIDISKERNNYLSSIQTLKFLKDGKDVFEAIDIERRSVVMKYLTAKTFDSQDTALNLLQKGLEDYSKLMEDKNGVNNYWRQFKVQCCNITNDPLQWKSSLTDPNAALEYIKPFPCQTDKTLPCANNFITDGQIENIIHTWKNIGTNVRKRKITNKVIIEEDDKDIEPEISEDVTSIQNDVPASQNFYSINKVTNQQPTKFVPASATNNQQVINAQLKPSNDNYSNIARNRYSRLNANKTPSILKPPANNPPEQEAPDLQRNKVNPFKTAYELKKEQQAKGNRPVQKKTLGGRSAVNAPFVCPLKRTQEETNETRGGPEDNNGLPEEMNDERMKNIEPKMVELIKNEIMDCGTPISWDDIAGLDFAKKIIKEVVVFPMLRPDIFTGLRRPPKGILLFGPPGTGKTLIGKCIASQSKSTFFSISASSLTSKWVGEGEKMVRALFAVARVYQPSVIFIDEIDSLLTQRSETEHESSRRIKTEFLVQLDGAATSEDDRILIVGATNRPQELDEAARRRLVKRLYVPLPELEARRQIVNNLLASIPHNLTQEQILEIAKQADGYSGADMTNLCKEASMGPIRSIPFSQLENVKKEDVRKVTVTDFTDALANVRPSVSQSDLSVYVEWDNTYGSGTARKSTR